MIQNLLLVTAGIVVGLGIALAMGFRPKDHGAYTFVVELDEPKDHIVARLTQGFMAKRLADVRNN